MGVRARHEKGRPRAAFSWSGGEFGQRLATRRASMNFRLQ
jgi:hypothetical protein